MGADLSDADLRGSHLMEADLTNATLDNADLAMVFLSDTKLVTARSTRPTFRRHTSTELT